MSREAKKVDSQVRRWTRQLRENVGGAAAPSLVRPSSGGLQLVEGAQRRPVSSGLVAGALIVAFGEPRTVSDEELAGWVEGPPVEVFRLPDGAPFIVVGGERRRLKGLPAPHEVTPELISAFPKGAAIDVAVANVPRAQFRRAVSGRYQLDRARAVGPFGIVRAVFRRIFRRTRRRG